MLIVEDERLVAVDLQQALAGMGYDAYATASSADEALREVAERRPDLVLMDIRIQGTRDGIETAALLRERFDLAIVYLTAHADVATIERATSTVPDGYLLKPVREAELRSTIEVSFQRLEQQRRARARERLLSSMPDAVIAVDRDDRITFVNPAAEHAVGPAHAALGRPSGEMLRLEPSPLAEVLRTRTATGRLEEVTLACGRAIGHTVAPVIEGGELLGAVMVFRDVTPRQPRAAAPTAVLRRGRILVVDDDALVRRAIARMLRQHDLVCLDSARAALGLIECGDRFDVVLSDVMMPAMTGIELYEELHRRFPAQASRVVFVTGSASVPAVDEFLRTVRNAVIEKPFSPADMKPIIERLLADS
ncbi:MAG: response regulator [Deltaproteobacteria bacterium]|nr:response regulator [Deltaproteobacteria bacterium]